MATSVPNHGSRGSSIQVKHVLWVVFGLMTLFVIWRRDSTLLDSHSFLRQRYAPIPWLMMLHGIPGALALCLGVFQFSDRLRRRYLAVHRIVGRIYVGCVLISAPLAIAVSIALADPILLPATIIQSTVWVATTGTGLYCARTGKIQQHKEWMIRSYPMAMVFIFVRTIGEIPAIARMGLIGVHTVVWSCIAVACFLPSFLISWQALGASRRVVKARAAA